MYWNPATRAAEPWTAPYPRGKTIAKHPGAATPYSRAQHRGLLGYETWRLGKFQLSPVRFATPSRICRFPTIQMVPTDG